MSKASPRIISINTNDLGGGAEKVAMDLHRSYLSLGLDSQMLVGHKRSDLLSVFEIPPTNWFQFWVDFDKKLLNSNIKGAYRVHKLINNIKAPYFDSARKYGKENYHYPESRRMVKQLQSGADIIHLHNLHANYFDLGMLPTVSRRKPVLITMHDEYLYTGHCACTLGCERWRTGCGECPHLDIYPPVKRDNTRYNWDRKSEIFTKSQLTLVTPSEWLAQRAKESLLSHLPVKFIPNGIDLSIFKPGSQAEARDALGLDQEAFIILYTAAGGRRSPFKDYAMLDRVIARLQAGKVDQKVILLALGGSQETQHDLNNITMVEKSFVNDPMEIARYYQACDLYIHTAKADNAPLVILEAMACGKPIVATNAGGIPELVREGETGYTVSIGDDEAMTERIISLINNPNRVRQMGANAAAIAKENYGLERMVSDYLDLYQELIDERNG